jgi:hypothetical protein
MRAKPEYIEGQQATANFEEGMTALFKVPKRAVALPKKNAKQPRAATSRKSKRSDED